jgi:cytochrome d ubiquinol oxidase subunit I
MFSETVLALSQWQMSISALLHFVFIPLTLGLSLLLVALESLYLLTDKPHYLNASRFWARLFTVNFSLAFASRLVLLCQFGAGSSYFSRYVGDVFALPLAIEALSSFFLASVLFGPFWFGWARLSKQQHWLITCLLALCLNLSALWLISAYAWLENPVGASFNLHSLRIELNDLNQLLNNPAAIFKTLHLLGLCYAIAAASVLAISAWLVSKNPNDPIGRISYKLAAPIGLIAILLAWPIQPTPSRLSQTIQQTALNGGDLQSLLPEVENHIRNGLTAYQTLLAWRDDDKNSALQAQVEQHQVDLGYALLLQRFTTHIENANQQQIQLAAQSALPAEPAALLWSHRLLIGLGVLIIAGFIAACVGGLGQAALKPWLMQLSILTAPLPWLLGLGDHFLNQASQQPWLVSELLPSFLSYSSLSVTALAINFGIYLIIGTGLVCVAGILMAYLTFSHARGAAQ